MFQFTSVRIFKIFFPEKDVQIGARQKFVTQIFASHLFVFALSVCQSNNCSVVVNFNSSRQSDHS